MDNQLDKNDAQIIGEALGVLDRRPNLVKESQKKATRYDNHVPVRRSWPLHRDDQTTQIPTSPDR